jgi:hypothetical protein
VLIRPKHFPSQNNTELYADNETVKKKSEKFATKIVIGKKVFKVEV